MVFNFFRFRKKRPAKPKVSSLSSVMEEIPIFSSLGPAELRLIERKVRRVEYKKGDTVYRAGEMPEAFYAVVSGRFHVLADDARIIGTLVQGDYFGESSILSGREHSATVIAKNDGIVLRISKDDFLQLVNTIPSLSLHISRTLGHRLARGISTSEMTETKMISIYARGKEEDKALFSWNLAAKLAEAKRKTILVRLGGRRKTSPLDQVAPPLEMSASDTYEESHYLKYIQKVKGDFDFLRLVPAEEKTNPERQISGLLRYLIDRYDMILLDMPADLDDMMIKSIQQSDQIYFLIQDDERNTTMLRKIFEEFKTSLGFSKSEIRILMLVRPGDAASTFVTASGDAAELEIFHYVPVDAALERKVDPGETPIAMRSPEEPFSKAVGYLSRELTGNLVGLALGSGAAFGFAHIGVLRVLEEERIPVDLIAGSSIGALIGALWSAGFSSYEIEKMGKSLDKKGVFFKLVGFGDLSMPFRGFFKGIQVGRFLRTYLDRKTFRDLNIPLKVVATDLNSGEEVICDDGDVVNAVRASISIPGIFRPVVLKGQTLIDGGVVDPLPVKVLSHYGARKIIAVNVLWSPDDHLQKKDILMQKQLVIEAQNRSKSFFGRMMSVSGGKIGTHYNANIFNVLMNTIQFLEFGLAESSAQEADIVLHPVVHDSHWAEFYSTEKFVKEGMTHTKEQLDEIKRLIEEMP